MPDDCFICIKLRVALLVELFLTILFYTIQRAFPIEHSEAVKHSQVIIGIIVLYIYIYIFIYLFIYLCIMYIIYIYI